MYCHDVAKKMLHLRPDAELPAGLSDLLDRVCMRVSDGDGRGLYSRQVIAAIIELWFIGLE